MNTKIPFETIQDYCKDCPDFPTGECMQPKKYTIISCPVKEKYIEKEKINNG